MTYLAVAIVAAIGLWAWRELCFIGGGHLSVGDDPPPPGLTCLCCDHPLEWCECLRDHHGLTDREIARAMGERAA